MSPKTVARRRHNRNPLSELGEFTLGMLGASPMGLPIALMTSEIVGRMLERQDDLKRDEHERHLTTAPLSAAQAEQERILTSMQFRTWPAEDFAAWVNARTGRVAIC